MRPDRLRGSAVETLRRAGIVAAERDVAILWKMCFPDATSVDQSGLPSQDVAAFERLVARRARREPMAHLRGYRDFYNHRFLVTADVLDPRPDTETLVHAALKLPYERVLDLGTGSGCILLSLLAARSGATGVGVDLSGAALEVASQNARRLRLLGKAEFLRSDWFDRVTGQFDLIVSNPPYVSADEMAHLEPEVRLFEPRLALTDEADGLSAYRRIAIDALSALLPGGQLMVEIGSSQSASVAEIFAAAGFANVKCLQDLDQRDRVICGQKSPESG